MAVETLRPDANGDVIQNDVIGAGSNYEAVDEVSPDEDATMVENVSSEESPPDTRYDLYGLPNSSIGAGVITNVRVYARCKRDSVE